MSKRPLSTEPWGPEKIGATAREHDLSLSDQVSMTHAPARPWEGFGSSHLLPVSVGKQKELIGILSPTAENQKTGSKPGLHQSYGD